MISFGKEAACDSEAACDNEAGDDAPSDDEYDARNAGKDCVLGRAETGEDERE